MIKVNMIKSLLILLFIILVVSLVFINKAGKDTPLPTPPVPEQEPLEPEFWESDYMGVPPPPFDDWLGVYCLDFLYAGEALTEDRSESFCQDEVNYLLIYNETLDASTIHDRWVESIEKAGIRIDHSGRQLSVFILDENDVGLSHCCTRFGSH
jgi:hypothetical protein